MWRATIANSVVGKVPEAVDLVVEYVERLAPAVLRSRHRDSPASFRESMEQHDRTIRRHRPQQRRAHRV